VAGMGSPSPAQDAQAEFEDWDLEAGLGSAGRRLRCADGPIAFDVGSGSASALAKAPWRPPVQVKDRTEALRQARTGAGIAARRESGRAHDATRRDPPPEDVI